MLEKQFLWRCVFCGYIYLDEGSSFTVVRDNWCPAEKFIRNANGPGNTWEKNGPSVVPAVRDAAGLEPAFRDLLSSAGGRAGPFGR